MDLKLGDGHDLKFVDNDLVLTTTESESLAQRLTIKLLTFEGEWYLDSEEGIPYFQSIFGKNRSKESVDAIFKKAITEEPEVEALLSYQSDIDDLARVFSVSFTVRSSNSQENVPVNVNIGGS